MPTRYFRIFGVACALLGLTSSLWAGPAVPETPAAADGLIYARPFVLEEGFRFDWYQGQETTTTGWLLVLKVRPELVYPRQTAEPVPYVGGVMALKASVGWPTGMLVVVVPGAIELATSPVWFGAPELPERVSPETARLELQRARAAGIAPFATATVAAASADGVLAVKNFGALGPFITELVERYAPAESRP